MEGGSVANSYSSHDATYGTITAANYAGGAIGSIANFVSPQYIYSSNPVVSAGGNVGGLIGSTSGSCTGCFWDTTTSGKTNSAVGSGNDTATLQTAAPFTGASWNGATIWNLGGNAYPSLM